jgi:RNA polymerase sigma-70 factor (ECF subfamily)
LILSGRKFNPFRTFSLEAFSDEVLLFAIAGGADWAMEPLYQRYSRQLYSLTYAMVAEPQVAQNLTQETFLAVWRHASAYAPQAGAVGCWLLSILRQVRVALMQIPLQQRSVIALAYFQGWTQSEIVQENGIPLGTVKARMRLGLLHLKQAFDRMGFTEL